jgi:nitrite reductase (NADH) small subunit/3-phenylpropionate/trans-cinnamate dioxygenase ferredoxin subunit
MAPWRCRTAVSVREQTTGGLSVTHGSRVRIAAVADVPPGTGRVVETGGKDIALFNVGGRFYAIDNGCPHRGGPLGEGDIEGTIVTCPWHAWRWDVTTGTNTNNPAVKVGCFGVAVEGGEVFLEVSG